MNNAYFAGTNIIGTTGKTWTGTEDWREVMHQMLISWFWPLYSGCVEEYSSLKEMHTKSLANEHRPD